MIYTIDLLETTECGPEAVLNDKYLQQVFIHQGSIDGACGPYSIIMGLMTLGIVDRDEIISFHTKGTTRLGKLLTKLNTEYYTLFKEGTHIGDLENIINKTFGKLLNIEAIETKNKNVINFTIEHLKQNHPTIIGVNFSGGGHWMLAIGYEINSEDEIERILLLDPSEQKPTVSSWNSIIDAKVSKKGIYPYKWWTKSEHIQFEHALAMWEK